MKKAWQWGVVIGAAVVVIVGLVSGIVVFGVHRYQWDAPWARTAAAILHVNAARVGRRNISFADYLAHLDAERQYLAGPAARAQGMPTALTPDLRKQALDHAIRIAAVEEFAQKQGVIVTPLDVDRTYDGLIAQAGTSTTPAQIQTFLYDEFGWDEADFKQYVVRPALTEDVLKQKLFNETKDENAFDNQLDERLKQPDIKVYLTF